MLSIKLVSPPFLLCAYIAHVHLWFFCFCKRKYLHTAGKLIKTDQNSNVGYG